MSEVTHILSAIEEDNAQAAEQLLPLVYDELRKLAAQKLAREKPGQTLQATALVHTCCLASRLYRICLLSCLLLFSGICTEGRNDIAQRD